MSSSPRGRGRPRSNRLKVSRRISPVSFGCLSFLESRGVMMDQIIAFAMSALADRFISDDEFEIPESARVYIEKYMSGMEKEGPR